MNVTNSFLIAGVTEVLKQIETRLFGSDSNKISGLVTVVVAVVVGLVLAYFQGTNLTDGVTNAVAAIAGMTAASKAGGN